MFGNKTETETETETFPYSGQKWEYKTVTIPAIDGGIKDQASKFNDLGQKGWEFQAVLGGSKLQMAVFKRPID